MKILLPTLRRTSERLSVLEAYMIWPFCISTVGLSPVFDQVAQPDRYTTPSHVHGLLRPWLNMLTIMLSVIAGWGVDHLN